MYQLSSYGTNYILCYCTEVIFFTKFVKNITLYIDIIETDKSTKRKNKAAQCPYCDQSLFL